MQRHEKKILEASVKNDYSFRKAFLEGAFTVPGDGCIDYKPFLSILRDVNYNGWLVVEAEQDPAKANPYEYSKKVSIIYIRQLKIVVLKLLINDILK